MTKNDCYQAGESIEPKGIMVHSTGVAQPDVNVFLRNWDRPGVTVCAHAFVSREGAVQTLPWNHRGWHAGSPGKGGVSANNTHISFEILEPAGHTYQGGAMVDYDPAANAAYFTAVYQNAVELAAHLCRLYGFNPLEDILCHSEGYAQGMASNHADVMHWFPKHGKSMDLFRSDVAAWMDKEDETLTKKEFDAYFQEAMRKYEAHREAQTVSGWAREAWEKAVAAGVFDGTKPAAPMTREQAAVVLDRLGLLP